MDCIVCFLHGKTTASTRSSFTPILMILLYPFVEKHHPGMPVTHYYRTNTSLLNKNQEHSNSINEIVKKAMFSNQNSDTHSQKITMNSPRLSHSQKLTMNSNFEKELFGKAIDKSKNKKEISEDPLAVNNPDIIIPQNTKSKKHKVKKSNLKYLQNDILKNAFYDIRQNNLEKSNSKFWSKIPTSKISTSTPIKSSQESSAKFLQENLITQNCQKFIEANPNFSPNLEEMVNKCNLCEQTFQTSDDLIEHIRVRHLQDKSIYCDICNKNFKSLKYKKRHMKNIHKGIKINLVKNIGGFLSKTLSLGDENFASKISPETEKMRKTTENLHGYKYIPRKYPCEFCTKGRGAKGFNYKKPFLKHLEEEHQFGKEICKEILQKYLTDKEKEFQKANPEEISDENCEKKIFQRSSKYGNSNLPHQCNICLRYYRKRLSLKFHQRKKHKIGIKEKLFFCEFCTLKFTSMTMVRQHLTKDHKKTKDNIEEISKNLWIKMRQERDPEWEYFDCHICFAFFNDQKDLDLHLTSTFHKDYRKYRCEDKECNNRGTRYGKNCFRSLSELNQHVDNIHGGVENFKCKHKQCPKSFKEPNRLKMHIRRSHTYVCDICEKGFLSKSILNRHTTLVHEESSRIFTCIFCDNVSYETKSSYLNHIAEVHEGSIETCNICDKIFKTRTHLLTHMGNVHEGNRKPKQRIEYKKCCKICDDKIYRTREELQNHIQDIHEGMSEKCKLCGKLFASRHSYKSHINYHHEGKNTKCNICDKIYKTREELQKHIKVNHKGMSEKCNYCDKVFLRRLTLQRHIMLIHEGVKKSAWKKFKCKICQFSFSSILNLKNHAKLVHRVSQEKFNQDNKTYKCDICTFSFSSIQNLNNHAKLVHRGSKEKLNQGNKTYKCEICTNVFEFFSSLKKHLESCGKKSKENFVKSPHQNISQKNNTFFTMDDLQELSDEEYNNTAKVKENMEKIFFCEFCERKFTSMYLLCKHLSKDHEKNSDDIQKISKNLWIKMKPNRNPGLKYLDCHICPAFFFKQIALKNHLNKSHPGRKLKCDLCKLYFQTSLQLIRHVENGGDQNLKCTFSKDQDIESNNIHEGQNKENFSLEVINVENDNFKEIKNHKSNNFQGDKNEKDLTISKKEIFCSESKC